MPFRNLVGLNVTNDALYEQYRAGMKPILHKMGGRFVCDFRIGEVLLCVDDSINRLFVIEFPDRESHGAFFSDPEYLSVRERYFGPSVETVIRFDEYETDAS